jgi:hypothetical protein
VPDFDAVLTEIARRVGERLGMGGVRVKVRSHRDMYRPGDRMIAVRVWWPDERKTNQIITTVINPQSKVTPSVAVGDIMQEMQRFYADRPWERAS